MSVSNYTCYEQFDQEGLSTGIFKSENILSLSLNMYRFHELLGYTTDKLNYENFPSKIQNQQKKVWIVKK